MAIRILIADGHPLIRSGIKNELIRHSDLVVVGEAVSADEVLHFMDELKPDIVLLDVNMPGPKAPIVLNEIKKTCRVLVITAYNDAGTIRGMLRTGANGYLLKDENPQLIPDAIRAVARGDLWLSPGVSKKVTSFKDCTEFVGQELTYREIEILQLIEKGNLNKQIALQMQVSVRTVEFHIGHIFQKLGVRNRVEAVVWAKEHGGMYFI